MTTDYTRYSTASKVSSTSYDQGLRDYMVSVYKYMALALMLTGMVSLIVASSPTLINLFLSGPLGILVAFSPLIMIFYMSFRFNNLSVQSAQICFWTFAGLMGISLSTIFLMYTAASITKVFFITSSMFGAMSIYGYSTKRDLTGFGSFLYMGLIGLIIASLINVFFADGMMNFMISVFGVIIFTGLTAYDVQKIKETYYQVGANGDLASKIGIYGALRLYMDFINLFVSLLRLMGQRRD